jgi:hypothetical protein
VKKGSRDVLLGFGFAHVFIPNPCTLSEDMRQGSAARLSLQLRKVSGLLFTGPRRE